jgi:hypothetical protein
MPPASLPSGEDHVRAAIVSIGLLVVSGCCWENLLFDDRLRSCVQEETGRCWDVMPYGCFSDENSAPPPAPECGASGRSESCAEGGYTVSCGSYAVRPGSSC